MFPVACTVATDPKFLDSFLREAYDGFPEASQDLCIIYTKDTSAYQRDESQPTEDQINQGAQVQTQGGGPMTTPSRPPWSTEVQSPFLDFSPEQVAECLKQDFRDTVLQVKYCAVLDEKSLSDRRAILVQTEGPFPEVEGDDSEPSILTARVPFERVNASLACYDVGETDIYEDLQDCPPR